MAQSCIIVGVGPGIGAALARRFGQEGYAVGILARRKLELTTISTTLGSAGIKVLPVVADAADPSALQAGISQVSAAYGPPDVLIYNAVAVTPKTASQLDPEKLVSDFRTGVVGALVATQAVLPAMRTAGRGTLLYTGGGFAFEPLPTLASLGIEKAALRNLVFSLAKELTPEGIHAATVTIGGMVKPGTALAPDLIAEAFWKLHSQAPAEFEREVVLRPQA